LMDLARDGQYQDQLAGLDSADQQREGVAYIRLLRMHLPIWAVGAVAGLLTN